MRTAMVVLVPMAFVLLLGAAVMAFIGVYVYRDAKSRGMNAPLWTLVALLVPSLIGLIVYLLVRTSHSNLQCPSCGTRVLETYRVCPACGAHLKAVCQNCGAAVEQGWQVCPYCAAPLDETAVPFTPPVQRKDRSIGKILILVVVLLLLSCLLMIGFVSFQVVGGGFSSSTGMTSYSVGDYLQAVPEARSWFEKSGMEYEKAYALRYTKQVGTGTYAAYAIYVPAAMNHTDTSSAGVRSTLMGRSLEVGFETGGSRSGNGVLYLVTCSSDDSLPLRVKLNNKVIPCEITTVPFNPVPQDGGLPVN